MRVVLGTFSFAQPGGTESYVFTVAHELRRLGHEPIVVAEEYGPMADFSARRGIDVARRMDELPPACDAVLAHDGIMTGALAERYPAARLVYVAHSDAYDHQLPILLPGVVAAVVAPSDRTAKRIRALALEVPIVRLRQPIDTERFADAGPIRARPRQALLLSHYLRGERRNALVSAWEAAGVQCIQVGSPGQLELDVVPAIAQADIVVAKARAALEGMSCGRAVYVCDDPGADGWVTEANYPALEADNFAGQATPSPPDFGADLERYRPDMGWINRELVRTHHNARRHAAELVQILRAVEPPREGVTAAGEIGRLTRSNWGTQQQVLALKQEAIILRERTLAAETASEANRAAVEGLGQARELLATRRVRIGIALGRALDRLRNRR